MLEHRHYYTLLYSFVLGSIGVKILNIVFLRYGYRFVTFYLNKYRYFLRVRHLGRR